MGWYRLHKLLLDHLQVKSVAVVIGGSMGGMSVLEWPLSTPEGYVRNIVPIATSPRHSAWGISWGEAQRQSIWSDPEYEGGWYKEEGEGPKRGLAAARMAALLTYRSRDSFESRFGRKEVDSEGEGSGKEGKASKGLGRGKMTDAWGTPRTQAERAEAAHNDGHRPPSNQSRPASPPPIPDLDHPHSPPSPGPIFSAQSYLRYQGDKFVSRFDANCYIHLSRKMDSHDVGRNRPSSPSPLSRVPPGALVIAISSDGLFTLSEQRELAETLPASTLVVVDSPDGHDGFLLEFEQINKHVLAFLHERLPIVYEGTPLVDLEKGDGGFTPAKASLFGEAEGDLTRW
jgi:homoserine O-acetyltransferase